jgi:uncharacterized protein with HEPN domain
MLSGAMLGLIERLAMDIIVLTEELGEAEFFASRLTRIQTLKLLKSVTKTVANMPAEVRQRLHEVDWGRWDELAAILARPEQHPLKIWVAIRELTPMTVQRLHDYKRSQPELFSMVP